MRVLAAIIIPSHLKNSGAVTAARELSLALSNYCEIDMALMATQTREQTLGAARLLERRSNNFFGFTQGWLSNKFRTPFYRSDIPNLILSGSYDLVHIHNVIPTLEMKRIAVACQSSRIPYVISTHGFVEVASSGKAYGLNIFERMMWKVLVSQPLQYVIDHASLVLALSPAEIPILKQYCVREDRIGVVPNGVLSPCEISGPVAKEFLKIYTRFQLPHKKDPEIPVCFYLGNHTPNKGIHILLEAFTHTDHPFTLVVGGKKGSHVNYEYYALKSKSGQQIVFTDKLSDEEVQAIFRYADLFVFPTLADTFPLVILEAMASGVPILSTRIGGIPYQVTPECGLLVEANNPIAFREGFEALVSDRAALAKMGKSAKERAREFTWEAAAEKAYGYYQKLHGNRQGS